MVFLRSNMTHEYDRLEPDDLWATRDDLVNKIWEIDFVLNRQDYDESVDITTLRRKQAYGDPLTFNEQVLLQRLMTRCDCRRRILKSRYKEVPRQLSPTPATPTDPFRSQDGKVLKAECDTNIKMLVVQWKKLKAAMDVAELAMLRNKGKPDREEQLQNSQVHLAWAESESTKIRESLTRELIKLASHNRSSIDAKTLEKMMDVEPEDDDDDSKTWQTSSGTNSELNFGLDSDTDSGGATDSDNAMEPTDNKRKPEVTKEQRKAEPLRLTARGKRCFPPGLFVSDLLDGDD